MFALLLVASMFEDAERAARSMAAAALVSEDRPAEAASALPDGQVTLQCVSISRDNVIPGLVGSSARDVTREALELGLAPLMLSPKLRWTIDFKRGEVWEDGEQPLKITDVTRSLLIASQVGTNPPRQLVLDRLDGRGELLVSADVTAWKQRYGDNVKPYRRWSLICQRVQAIF